MKNLACHLPHCYKSVEYLISVAKLFIKKCCSTFLRDLANNLSSNALLTEMQYLSMRPGVVCLAVLLASSKYFLDKVRGQGFGGRGFGPGREYFNPLKSVLYFFYIILFYQSKALTYLINQLINKLPSPGHTDINGFW